MPQKTDLHMKLYRYSLVNTVLRPVSTTDDATSSGPASGEEYDPMVTPPEDPGIRFFFQSASVTGYGSHRPVSKVEFSFPADDGPRVQAWFTGNFERVTLPESDTLRKNRRKAVIDCLEKYYGAARNADLFTAPFRIGHRFRLRDDSWHVPSEPVTLFPNVAASDIVVTAYRLQDKWLSTDVELTNMPGRLMVGWDFPADADFLRRVEAVEFYATRQVAFHASDAEVTGLRTLDVEGTPRRCWTYDSYRPESLATAASTDTDFRILCEIPAERFAEASEGMSLPLAPGTLRLFDALPKPGEGHGGDSGSSGAGIPDISPDNPAKETIRVRFRTDPICMELPEKTKQVRDLFLRGVFRRDDMRLELFGSHHRENWRLLCRSSGPWIRGLCRSPYRWYRVEGDVTLRHGDFLEALAFRYTLR